MRRPSPRAAERALTWLVTGPVGHLAAGLLDWIELLLKLGAERARRGGRRGHEW